MDPSAADGTDPAPSDGVSPDGADAIGDAEPAPTTDDASTASPEGTIPADPAPTPAPATATGATTPPASTRTQPAPTRSAAVRTIPTASTARALARYAEIAATTALVQTAALPAPAPAAPAPAATAVRLSGASLHLGVVRQQHARHETPALFLDLKSAMAGVRAHGVDEALAARLLDAL